MADRHNVRESKLGALGATSFGRTAEKQLFHFDEGYKEYDLPFAPEPARGKSARAAVRAGTRRPGRAMHGGDMGESKRPGAGEFLNTIAQGRQARAFASVRAAYGLPAPASSSPGAAAATAAPGAAEALGAGAGAGMLRPGAVHGLPEADAAAAAAWAERDLLATGEDAMAFFVRHGASCPVKFVHLNRADGGDHGLEYNPYALHVVNEDEVEAEHFTMSAQGVVHICPGTPSEFFSLSEWSRHASLFAVIRNINFFRSYLARKAYDSWAAFARFARFRRRRAAVAKSLFLVTPAFTPAMAEVGAVLAELARVPLLDLRGWRFTLEGFMDTQEAVRKTAASQLETALGRITDVLRKVCEDVTKRARAGMAAADAESALYARENKGKSMQQLKREAAARKAALTQARWEEAHLGSLIRLVDYAAVEALSDAVQTEFERLLWEGLNFPADDGRKKMGFFHSCIQFDVSGCVFSPSRDDFRSMMAEIVDETIKVCYGAPRVLQARIFKPFVSELPRERSRLSAPSVATLLSDSARFKQALAGIEQKFDDDFAAADAHAALPSFAAVRPIHDFKVQRSTEEGGAGAYFEAIAEASDGDAQLAVWIATIKSWETAVSEIRAQAVCGALFVDGRPLQEDLEPAVAQYSSLIRALLVNLAHDRAEDAYSKFAGIITALERRPDTLQEFADYVESVQAATKRAEEVTAASNAVDDLYELLATYGVKVPLQASMWRNEMQAYRESCIDAQIDAEKFIKLSLPEMKETLDTHKVRMNDWLVAMNSALAGGEFVSADSEPAQVLESLRKIRVELQGHEDSAAKFTAWHALFDMMPYEFTALKDIIGEFDRVLEVWEGLDSFAKNYEAWTTDTWLHIDAAAILDEVNRLYKRAFKLEKQLGTDAAKLLKDRVTAFRAYLPVIEDLGNPAMKPRHWKKLYAALGTPFSEEMLPRMTLAGLLAMDVMAQREVVQEISGAATGEASLESGLEAIQQAWREVEFFVTSYRDQDGMYILGGLDDIVTQLEDSQVSLQSMLGSRYIAGVRDDVEAWARKLSMLSDTLDEWVTVQGSWMYLENIFSADDIQRQLPAEAQKFAMVDKKWREVMAATAAAPAALNAVDGFGAASSGPGHTEGSLLRTFQHANVLLDEIQKSLEDYLETKRAGFARFYFLSNDELLQILSQTREPQAVQPHLEKCFDAMKRLEFGKDAHAADMYAMVSPDGERVQFSTQVAALGPVEDWLGDVEYMMRTSLYDLMKLALAEYPSTKEGAISRREWMFQWPAQVTLAVDQIHWTRAVQSALSDIASGANASAMHECLDFVMAQIDAMVMLVRGDISRHARTLLGALVVLDVHGRDVIRSLIAGGAASPTAFEWTRQLRYYWEPALDNAVIRQTNTRFLYGYEYLGNTPRLVITPLTDKCYMTLTGALHLKFGGAPAGPAGTGKTETTKDLAKALAVQCVVFNCSDGLDYKMMGRFFSGLAQAGAWACFDEFNRIDIEVLSVIAQQILTIQQGLSAGSTAIEFEGREIPLNPGFGVFITMNPGYAGRTELPDNLKALFRPVAMMVPDYRLIAEIILFSQGFTDALALSNKMAQLYKLSSEQLSKQDHYDFGMRAVKSVLVAAGALKRKEPEVDENILLIRAMRDSNVPKFLEHDLPLFYGILSDLFPGVQVPYVDYGALQTAIELELRRAGLQVIPALVSKVIQVHETQLVRHGMMLVGAATAGKTVATHTLAAALTQLHASGITDKDEFYKPVDIKTLNPKSVTMGELYGATNKLTGEWADGLVAKLVRDALDGDMQRRVWVLFDGPVDAIWIENMNTVLDDNKMLCLPNGERIKLASNMHMLFEVADLAVASPATVSRCGMVYMEPVHVGWEALVDTWARGPVADWLPGQVQRIASTIKPLVAQALRWLRTQGKQVVLAPEATLVRTMLALLTSLLQPEHGVRGAGAHEEGSSAAAKAAAEWGAPGSARLAGAGDDAESKRSCDSPVAAEVKSPDSPPLSSVSGHARAFTFSGPGAGLPEATVQHAVDLLIGWAFTWAFGGNLHDSVRDQFSAWAAPLLAQHKLLEEDVVEHGDLFAWGVDCSALLPLKHGGEEGSSAGRKGKGAQRARAVRWEEQTPDFVYDRAAPYFSILVPTTDTVKYATVLRTAAAVNQGVYLTGETGVGKSVIVADLMAQLSAGDDAKYAGIVMNFSAQTASSNVQEMLEAKLDRKRKNLLGAPAGKTMVVFVDDLNMPAKETYGAQPPIELLRQAIDQGGFYDRAKLFFKAVTGCVFIAAAAPPGGGRSETTARLTRHFAHLWAPALSDASMTRIFSSILRGFLLSVAPSIVSSAAGVVKATVALYRKVERELLPTPSRSHYTFNLRDVSKVFQGILMLAPSEVTDVPALAVAWAHESARVFRDRLICEEDRAWFNDVCSQQMESVLGLPELAADRAQWERVLFGDYLSRDSPAYARVPATANLPSLFGEYLEEYNVAFPTPMHLVFFADAIEHVSRIARILRQPRGNALLVGVGGSGRSSLTRLAAFIAEYQCTSIEIRRGYGMQDWREDVKRMLMTAGAQGKHCVFRFSDTQIVHEAFLEDINNLLNAGDIPALYEPEDLEAIMGALRPVVKAAGIPETRDNMFAHYITRVREHLHIVLAMSPIGGSFRARCRQFPALVNCCTIDWFDPWPADALHSVAASFLSKGSELGIPADLVDPLCQQCVAMHQSVEAASVRFQRATGRRNYTTPTSYLELIRLYTSMLGAHRDEVTAAIARYRGGLDKIESTDGMVRELQESLTALQPTLVQAAADTEELLERLAVDQKEADRAAAVAAKDEEETARVAASVKAIKDDCQRDLDEALPAYYSAVRALKSLDKKDIQETKSFNNPPRLVGVVMEAVCLLLGRKPTWDDAKKALNEMDFLQQLERYDKDNIDPRIIRKLKRYIQDPEFEPSVIEKVSKACTSLCMWCRAMYKYDAVAKNIAPKREKLAGAEEELAKAQEVLDAKRAALAEVQARVAELQANYEQSLARKSELERQQETTAVRLQRAKKLIAGLGDERGRWAASAARLEEDRHNLIGNIALAAACVAYQGPFTASFRAALTSTWVEGGIKRRIPVDPKFAVSRVLADPVQVREWQLAGLPVDDFSTENALFAAKGRRWPLFIDPQAVANRWVRRQYSSRSSRGAGGDAPGLRIIKLSQPDFLRTLENAIRFGAPVLCENVGEALDPALDPVLQKQIFRKGGLPMIRLGDSDVQYSDDFRLFITTKLPNPHYMPEVCIQVTVINFTVTRGGLEDQLLGELMRRERPDLEQEKDALIVSIAGDKRALKEIEDKILRMLAESTGDILDDEALIDSLAASKTTSAAISARMAKAEETSAAIDEAREVYRPVATRGSLLYFVIADLANVDPMYQFSLQAFVRLYCLRVEKSEKSAEPLERVQLLIADITWAFYANTCRGLFERHKLLFSFLIAVAVAQNAGQVTSAEYDALLRGAPAPASGTAAQLDAPAWFPPATAAKAWAALRGLSAVLESAAGLAKEVGQAGAESGWAAWIQHEAPATQPLPGAWDQRLGPFGRLLVLRALREEATVFALRDYVGRTLGEAFTEPPNFDLGAAFADSSSATPLIFVLSPGADPIDYIIKLAAERGVAFQYISLGQGQGPNAERKMEAARRNGDWVCLQNCHLAASWLPKLEALLEAQSGTDEHPDYRLWLTSMPSEAFPVPILQAGVKITQEPPRGLRANLRRIFADFTQDDWDATACPAVHRKLLFALGFYHALILERRKFGAVGWNIPYEWMNSDLKTGALQLQQYLDESLRDGAVDPSLLAGDITALANIVPWETLNSVIGDITYGGRATDAWDKRANVSILRRFFCAEVLQPGYNFSPSGVYYAPDAPTLAEARMYIDGLPLDDAPEAFGLHDNARISLHVKESNEALAVLQALAPDAQAGGEDAQQQQEEGAGDAGQAAAAGAEGAADSIPAMVQHLAARVPPLLQLPEQGLAGATSGGGGGHADDESQGAPDSMAVFVQQEAVRFNKLLRVLSVSLAELDRALRGVVVMSSELEGMAGAMRFARVPPAWEAAAYPCLKPLASWFDDLCARVEAIRAWLQGGAPAAFWLSGFFFPQGFMTAVLQTHARKYAIPIDTLGFETRVTHTMDPDMVSTPADDGVFIHGLFLEGGGWARSANAEAPVEYDPAGRLVESAPGQLFAPMPVIWLAPALEAEVGAAARAAGAYPCPLYKTSTRAGTLSTTGHSTNFVVTLQLPSAEEPDHWVRRGTALLTQLDE